MSIGTLWKMLLKQTEEKTSAIAAEVLVVLAVQIHSVSGLAASPRPVKVTDFTFRSLNSS